MEIKGFVTEILYVQNAAIFCFKNHTMAWDLLKNLKPLMMDYRSYRFKINCVFTPDKEYAHMVVIESINRLSDIYTNGMYKKEVDIETELKLLNSIVATLSGDYIIIYSGDYPRLVEKKSILNMGIEEVLQRE